jgi:group I intron endonuclease
MTRIKLNDHCTIYLLTNTTNNKIYIGQTWMPLEKRMGREGRNYSNSPYLYNAIKKDGYNNFTYTILETCEDQATADKLETEYIIKYDSRNLEKGYNLKEGGSAGRHSQETIDKITQTSKDNYANLTDEGKEKVVSKIIGYWTGKERGPHTEEWKEENSIRTKKWHAEHEHPMQGKTHSDEAIAKISASSKKLWESGEVFTPEVIKNRAKSLEMPEERQQAIIKAYLAGDAVRKICNDIGTSTSGVYRVLDRNHIPLTNNFSKWKGRTHSKETKEKMTASHKELWKERKSIKNNE